MACICLRFFFGIKGRKLDLYLDILNLQRSLFIRKHGETYGKAFCHGLPLGHLLIVVVVPIGNIGRIQTLGRRRS
jgi:hypothetical protein